MGSDGESGSYKRSRTDTSPGYDAKEGERNDHFLDSQFSDSQLYSNESSSSESHEQSTESPLEENLQNNGNSEIMNKVSPSKPCHSLSKFYIYLIAKCFLCC